MKKEMLKSAVEAEVKMAEKKLKDEMRKMVKNMKEKVKKAEEFLESADENPEVLESRAYSIMNEFQNGPDFERLAREITDSKQAKSQLWAIEQMEKLEGDDCE